MCGIAGFIDATGSLGESTLRRMHASLQHRGPDDRGSALLTEGGNRIGLAHTRLAILDLTEVGHQPMRFGPFSIVYNGEVYNFREIREELAGKGHAFVTDCDTEVILHAFAEWGIDCLDRFIGMFAFALHDSNSRKVFFVRDRAGVKPLYIYAGSRFLLFGSELKALRACREFQANVSLQSLGAYFRHGHVPDGHCIYQDCYKVDAGTYWIVDTEHLSKTIVKWWDQTDLYRHERIQATFEEAVDVLQELLESACSYRMVSDVPVGVFLSGGYDSTSVAAVLQAQGSAPIKTFTIGFTEGNDEAPAAREIAAILGTEHHEFYCSPKEAIEVIPQLPEIYDEPFADSSGIPTVLVSRLAREHVKVALSADGGDELFGGYNSYPMTMRRVRWLRKVPRGLRGILGKGVHSGLAAIPKSAAGVRHKLDGIAQSLCRSEALMGQRLHGESRLMPRQMVQSLVPSLKDDVLGFKDREWPSGMELLDACMALDYQTYLKDDILTKVDRATMSVGLEGREPLLDHRIAAFAARLPAEYKWDGVNQKRVLKELVHRYVPSEKMARPKTGFALPIMRWLKNELADLCENVWSDADHMEALGIDAQVAKKWYEEFKSGGFYYTPLIWRIFCFRLWQRRWL